MKYLKELQAKKIFTLADVVELTHNVNSANSLILDYKKSGLIASVRKNLYVALDLVSSNPLPSKYEIASHVSETSFVSHHSAMEYHGVANQIFYEVTISAKERIRSFSYDGLSYYAIQTDILDSVVNPPLNPLVRVTSMERTVVDCIHDIYLAGGLEELLECIRLIPNLDGQELLKCLLAYNQKKLWQKTGFLLEQHNQLFRLPNSFFEECKKHIGTRKNYFCGGKGLVYYSDWKLYAPEKILDITEEGDVILV